MTSDATPSGIPPWQEPGAAGKVSGRISQHEQVLWRQFDQASQDAEYYHSWLALQCQQINHCMRGVLVLGPVDTGPFVPVAFWPQGQGGCDALAALAEQSLTTRQGMVQQYTLPGVDPDRAARHGVAWPVVIDGRLYGVVAVEVMPRTQAALQADLRRLQWASGWLEARLRKQQADEAQALSERLVAALDLMASSLEQQRYAEAAKGFVTELATRLGCERVSIGFVRSGHMRVEAVSHNAQFGREMNLIRAIASAMDEAMDQQATIQYPPPPDATPLITRNHAELASRHGATSVLTTPLIRDGEVYGVLCLERGADIPFDAGTVELCRGVAAVVGPVLAEKRDNDRWLITKAMHALRTQVGRLIGPEYFLRKLVFLGIAALVAFLALATGEYTIKADTVLEGSVQRVIVAPFEGYVATAHARAGDVVAQGAILAALDDRDLKLERLKWSSQRMQLSKQHDDAMARRDRAQINIIGAQIAQADAQLALIDEQLSRTAIIAPFPGIVISGDLDQSLGASVRRGDVLFEIAPLDDYRVILKVNEHDIEDVELGQQGRLVLSAMPDTEIPFSVQRITPVSTAEDGENHFRVEARMVQADDAPLQDLQRLRPGMEGAGKIHVDERKLIWVWTHGLVDRLRLWVWRWMP